MAPSVAPAAPAAPVAQPEPLSAPAAAPSAPPAPTFAPTFATAGRAPATAPASTPSADETPAEPAASTAASVAPPLAGSPPLAPEALRSDRPAAPSVAPRPAPAPRPSAPTTITAKAFGARDDDPEPEVDAAAEPGRAAWLSRLKSGLRKTGASITQVFVATRIDDALYEDLEAALLQADAGGRATEYLLEDLKQRVRRTAAKDVPAIKGLLIDALADLLKPLEKSLVVGEHTPTVMMVVGVNGAGKTTSVGKLARHLVEHEQKVLLAAADTFRAAAREQLAAWAQRADVPGMSARPRGQVEIVGQEGGDPAGVTFDAVTAGRARDCDVVLVDTAGRLTTQLHLMEELKKIRRVIGKAQAGAPHEVLLVIDGNTGQNALSQVKLFDEALDLSGLVITKLDGTAKGGVLAAVALWSSERPRPLPVYFIGVGEKLEDLQTFRAREFARALVG
ncbi:signal recognition particle-docking protein FtsY [Piscinibacter koreensis]|uniref:Signal recognition particle receptor FtsY n=1 Tax=Piscinibacter koreensis TaxID=2742824 RepID=A0A7Y6TW43_9BURK|nr:signal recognition particle-docking protein FtsY [Schlegelella koreensis]NUZ05690.1 signal recognition particle-docking protein FtsY [Schlegelella koreensis]